MGKEIWDSNLDAIKKWYPEFAEVLCGKFDIEEDVAVKTEQSQDGEVIFRVTKEDKELYLNGRRNAKEPVKIWRKRLGRLHKYAPVFLFGVGSGLYLKELVEHTEKEVNIVVYEPSIRIFLTLLREVDLAETIKNRPIAFVVEGINETEYVSVLDQLVVLENLEFLVEDIHPNYKELFAEKLLGKIKTLHSKVDRMMVNHNAGMLFQKNIAQNVMANARYMCDGYHTISLHKVIPYDGPAILVAAGPSLNKNINELKKAKNKAFILAVDTALKPLLKNGIRPDAFITIDPNKPLDLIDIEGAEDIPIIAVDTAHYTLLEHQKGKKIFYSDGYLLPRTMYQKVGKELPSVDTGGSVACSGLSLLFKMGFDTIILVGQDLAYTNDKSHADGTFKNKMEKEDTSKMIMVKGNYQDKVPTIANLKLYLEWFSNYIERMKITRDVRIVNATEGGAYIDGTELMTLKDVIEETCTKEIDFEKRIENMESEFSLEERKKVVEYLHTVPKEYEDIIKKAKSLKNVYQKLENIGKTAYSDKKACLKYLKKIKKLNKQCMESMSYELIAATMEPMEYIIRSEYFYEEEHAEDEILAIAKKGKKYSELVIMCAELMRELANEYLATIE